MRRLAEEILDIASKISRPAQELTLRWKAQALATKVLYPQEAILSTPVAKPQEAGGDDVAVEAFAVAMKEKLAIKAKQGRGGWNDPEQCSVEYLAKLLLEHVPKGDPVDIANFCMMLWHRDGSEAIREACRTPRPVPQPVAVEGDVERVAKALADSFRGNCLAGSDDAERMAIAAIAALSQPPAAAEDAVELAIEGMKGKKREFANENGLTIKEQRIAFSAIDFALNNFIELLEATNKGASHAG